MAVSCEKGSADYLRQLMQLLPPGYAWQWSPASAGRHLLAAWNDELARVHVHFCRLAHEGISRFAGELSGWSAADYERLMRDEFDLPATISDGLLPFTCESACTDHLLEENIRYVIVFTVDDVSLVKDAVYDYLNRYKQSHTHYLFRDRSVSVESVKAIESMHLGDTEHEGINHYYPSTASEAEAGDPLIERPHSQVVTVVTNGMHCLSPLYEQPFTAKRLIYHWSYSADEVREFPEYQNIVGQLDGTSLLIT